MKETAPVNFNLQYIFPEIFIETKKIIDGHLGNDVSTTDNIMLMTTIRKKHVDGLYYLQTIIHRRKSESRDDPQFLINSFKSFVMEVYLNQQISIVAPEQKDIFNEPVYAIDPDQTSEEERLLKMIKR